jgi:DNA-binding NtrC family response regulator
LRGSTQAEKQVLVVDPDEAFGQVLKKFLGPGYACHRVSSVEEGISQLGVKDLDVVLVNLDLPNSSSGSQGWRALLQATAERVIAPSVIVYSWDTRRQTALEVLQQGAFDFFDQPLDIHALKFGLERAYRRTTLLRDLAAAQSLLGSEPIEGLLGNSKAMEEVGEVVRKVAGVLTTVLLTGESGTGKGVVARAIHRLSSRADKPFIAFSPCALPESLIEDELFGHEKGAFTGATQSRHGRFEEAKGGTVFLDEIGDLPLPMQTKLLRVLQDRTLERLGSNVAVPVDVRVICATNRNLAKMVQEGAFREDLYFRISVIRIHVPALRERGEDIPLLAEYFLRMFAKAHSIRVRSLTPGFLRALASHYWPGNVRELQNVIERSLVLANGSEQLGVGDLPPELRGLAVSDEVSGGSFHQAVRNFKRELVRSALRLHSGNKLRAAQALHISRCYLYRLLHELNIPEAVREEKTLPPEGADVFVGAQGMRPGSPGQMSPQ